MVGGVGVVRREDGVGHGVRGGREDEADQGRAGARDGRRDPVPVAVDGRPADGLVEQPEPQRPAGQGVLDERRDGLGRQVLEVADGRTGEGKEFLRLDVPFPICDGLALEVGREVALDVLEGPVEPAPHDEPFPGARDHERVEAVGLEVGSLAGERGLEQARDVGLGGRGEEPCDLEADRLARPEQPLRAADVEVIRVAVEQVADRLAVGPRAVVAHRRVLRLAQAVRRKRGLVHRDHRRRVRPNADLDGVLGGDGLLVAADHAFGDQRLVVGRGGLSGAPEPLGRRRAVEVFTVDARRDQVAAGPLLGAERVSRDGDLAVVAQGRRERRDPWVSGIEGGLV